MRTSAAYLLQWETVRLLKTRQIRYYDLHGINPNLNPGTYHFKKGLAGKTGREVNFIGQVQAFEGSIANYSLLLIDRWRNRMRASRARSKGASTSEPSSSRSTSLRGILRRFSIADFVGESGRDA
jgi:hypothetical protein